MSSEKKLKMWKVSKIAIYLISLLSAAGCFKVWFGETFFWEFLHFLSFLSLDHAIEFTCENRFKRVVQNFTFLAFLLQNIKHCNLKHFKLNIVDEKANLKHTIGSTFLSWSETGWLESKICSWRWKKLLTIIFVGR